MIWQSENKKWSIIEIQLNGGEYAAIINDEKTGKTFTVTGTDCGTYFSVERNFVGTKQELPFYLIQAVAAAAMAQAEAEKAAAAPAEQMSWEDELKAEIQAKVDTKIQKAAPASKASMWIGADKMELTGSKLLDFMEFIFIDSEGDIITDAQLDKRCQAMAEDDGSDLTADSYMDNFADMWGDYKRAWAAANADQLCECCKGKDVNGFGSVKGSETKSIIRMITCPECKGDGLKVEAAAAPGSKVYGVTFKDDGSVNMMSNLTGYAYDSKSYDEIIKSDLDMMELSSLINQKAAKSRTISEMEKLIQDYGPDYHQGFFIGEIERVKAELEALILDECIRCQKVSDQGSYDEEGDFLCQSCQEQSEDPGADDLQPLDIDDTDYKKTVCELCGDTGRVADDILCWKCPDPFLEDLSKDADQHLKQLLQPDHIKEMIIQEMAQISQSRGINGQELQDGIKWMRSCSLETLKRYVKELRDQPELIMSKEERDSLWISW
jgi:hypothetical protein